MALSAAEIRKTRLSLGWSAAELARRIGHSVETVLGWETSNLKPDRAANSFLRYLQANAEQIALRVAETPLAEQWLTENKVAQIPRYLVTRK